MLTIDERITDDGGRERLSIDLHDGELRLFAGERPFGALPVSALDAVMRRYGRPLEGGAPLPPTRFALPGGAWLAVLRHQARWDVLPRDWLVYGRDGAEPVADIATSIAAALVHLAQARTRLAPAAET